MPWVQAMGGAPMTSLLRVDRVQAVGVLGRVDRQDRGVVVETGRERVLEKARRWTVGVELGHRVSTSAWVAVGGRRTSRRDAGAAQSACFMETYLWLGPSSPTGIGPRPGVMPRSPCAAMRG